MSCSVVIPTYNRPEQLKACLEALCEQSMDAAWEVVVVDDGGLQDLTKLIHEFKSNLDITYLRQENSGPATARNKGALKARGSFIAFLDDDCEPEKDWLSTLYAQKAPNRMVGGHTINKLNTNSYSHTSQNIVSFLYEIWKGTPWYFFTSNNFMVHRQTFLDMRGFDESFPTSAGEDREFCARWIHLGYQMSYCGEAIIWHSHYQTLRSFWKMHFKYGKASIPLRKNIRNFNLNPPSIRLSFYWELLKYVKRSGDNVPGKVKIMLLAVISQLATFSGFFVASWSNLDNSTSAKQNGHHREIKESANRTGALKKGETL